MFLIVFYLLASFLGNFIPLPYHISATIPKDMVADDAAKHESNLSIICSICKDLNDFCSEWSTPSVVRNLSSYGNEIFVCGATRASFMHIYVTP